jgi:mannose-6-phosphate isomerase-like protein (cupin superfamily)
MTEQHHFPIAAIAEESTNFERVLWTGLHAQLVIIALQAGEAMGEEIHEHGDQVLVVVRGSADVLMEGGPTRAEPGDVVVIPRGIRHDVVNPGPGPLVLHTVYAPPQHAAYGLYPTRAEAEAAEESGEDLPPLPSN